MPVSRLSVGSEKYVKIIVFNESITAQTLTSLYKLATASFNYLLVPSLQSAMFYEFSDGSDSLPFPEQYKCLGAPEITYSIAYAT